MNQSKKRSWIHAPMRYKSFRIATHPYLLLSIALFSFGYAIYNDIQKERSKVEKKVLAAFDTDRNGIISREEIRQEYPAMSIQYGADELKRIFHRDRGKFEDF